MSVQPEIRTAKKEKENKEQIKTRTNLFRFFMSQRSGKGFVSFSNSTFWYCSCLLLKLDISSNRCIQNKCICKCKGKVIVIRGSIHSWLGIHRTLVLCQLICINKAIHLNTTCNNPYWYKCNLLTIHSKTFENRLTILQQKISNTLKWLAGHALTMTRFRECSKGSLVNTNEKKHYYV